MLIGVTSHLKNDVSTIGGGALLPILELGFRQDADLGSSTSGPFSCLTWPHDSFVFNWLLATYSRIHVHR
jgi:hypothetical protein